MEVDPADSSVSRLELMRRFMPCAVLVLLLFSIACGRGSKLHRSRLTGDKLAAASRSGEHLEVAEMAAQMQELREWQERRRQGIAHPFDEPDGAQAFFLMKRLPPEQT